MDETAAPPPESKEVRVIKAKIKTKKDEIASISQIGPILLLCFGILVCITIVGIIPGLILIGVAAWWSNSRENEGKRLRNEVKELEAEME